MGPVGPLQPLTSPLCVHISGTFELTDPSGLPNGHIDVTLKWKFTYLPPPGSTMTVEQAKFVPKKRPVKLTTQKVEEKKVEVEENREEEEDKREGKKEELMVVKEEKWAKALLPLPTTSTASEVSTGTMRVMLAWSGMV